MSDNMTQEYEAAVKRATKLFVRANKHHRAAFHRYAVSFGMHRSQHRMLMYLCKQGGNLSQKELAEAMDVSPAAITVMLNKLEMAGYIYRTVSRADSRVNLISPTEKGQALATDSRRYFESIDRAMFEGFDTETINVLCDAFERMQNNLSNITERGDSF